MFELRALLEAIGYAGIFAIVVAESGLLVGFFLPGDSLLFTAGFLASQGVFHIVWLILLLLVASVLGAALGYLLGRRFGRRIFSREDSWFFHRDHVARAERLFARHGMTAVALARFLPVVRAFVPVVAGTASMAPARFFLATALGAGVWTVGLPLLGYVLGDTIPNVDRYLLPIVLGVVLLSLLPAIVHVVRARRSRPRPPALAGS